MSINKSVAATLGTVLLSVAAVTGSFAQPASSSPAPATNAQEYKWKTPKLNRAQIDALLVNPGKLLVIDVRRPDEISKIGGLPVYLNIQANELEQNLAYIPKDRNIVTASNHAGRAGAAADLLSSKGFKVVGAIGVQNYEEEGGKLTKIQPPAPKPVADAK